jgi:hypothetical protein
MRAWKALEPSDTLEEENWRFIVGRQLYGHTIADSVWITLEITFF